MNNHFSIHQGSRIKFGLNFSLTGSWGIYLNELFRRISTSMVGLFIPLYIWHETGKLEYIPLYYFFYSFTALSFEYIGAKVIRKIGVDWSMAIGSFFRAIFLYSLIFAKFNHIFFAISAFFFGLTQPFDWLTHYYCLAKISSGKKSFGKVVSYSKMITRIGSAIGPLLGGLIIQFFGFTWLYIIAGTMIIVSAIMPFLDQFERSGMHVSLSDIFSRLKDPGIKKHLVVYFIENFEALVTTVVWPLFLYTALKSYSKSGLLETISLALGILILYIINKILSANKFKIMYLGSTLLILGWAGRLLGNNGLSLTTANIVYLSGSTLLWVPIWSLLYAKSVQKKYTMEFWLVHEVLGFGFEAIIALLFYFVIKMHISYQYIIYSIIGLTFITYLFPKLYKDYIAMVSHENK